MSFRCPKEPLHYKQILPAAGWRAYGIRSELSLMPTKISPRSQNGEIVIEELPVVGWVLPEPWEDEAGFVHRDEIELLVAWYYGDSGYPAPSVCSISEACKYDDGFLEIWTVAPGQELTAENRRWLLEGAEEGLREKRARAAEYAEKRKREQAAMSEPLAISTVQ